MFAMKNFVFLLNVQLDFLRWIHGDTTMLQYVQTAKFLVNFYSNVLEIQTPAF